MPKIFVTGGNGFIGSRVVSHLIEQGYAVRCLLRPTSKTERIDDLNVERMMGDIRDIASLEHGMKGCDGVIHLAGLDDSHDIHVMHEVIVGGSQNVLQTAQTCGNLRTVYVSSTAAINGTKEPHIQNENSPFELNKQDYSYAFAKHEVEQRCPKAVREGLPVVIVNPAGVYGAHDTDLISAGDLVDFAKSNPILIPNGGINVVHVDDVAAGIIAAFSKGRPGERYILGGDNLTMRELAALIIELLGQKKKIITLPNIIIIWLAKLVQTLHLPLWFNPTIIPYVVRYWWMDNTKARSELGVNFRSAHETLAPTLHWLRENGYLE